MAPEYPHTYLLDKIRTNLKLLDELCISIINLEHSDNTSLRDNYVKMLKYNDILKDNWASFLETIHNDRLHLDGFFRRAMPASVFNDGFSNSVDYINDNITKILTKLDKIKKKIHNSYIKQEQVQIITDNSKIFKKRVVSIQRYIVNIMNQVKGIPYLISVLSPGLAIVIPSPQYSSSGSSSGRSSTQRARGKLHKKKKTRNKKRR